MSPLSVLWLASAVGALLFFTSGFLSARGSRQPAQALRDPESELMRGELEQLQELQANESERRARLERQLEYSEAATFRVQQALQQAQAERASLGAELAPLRQTAAAVPTLQRQLGELRQALDAKTRAQERAESRTQGLETQLLQLRKGAQRLSELEAYAEQNARLTSERDGLKSELDRLFKVAEAQRKASLRLPAPATPSTSRVASSPRPSQSGTTLRVQKPENTLEASLRRHLSLLIVRDPDMTAVLSDDRGFPLVGVGPEPAQEAVSALTSLAHELAARAREFIGLEQIELMEMAGADGRALRVRFFKWEDQPLALGSLGKRRLVSIEDEETLVSKFPELLMEARTG